METQHFYCRKHIPLCLKAQCKSQNKTQKPPVTLYLYVSNVSSKQLLGVDFKRFVYGMDFNKIISNTQVRYV